MHDAGVDNVLEYDPDVDYYEDDEPMELVREIASRPPELVSEEPLSVMDVAAAILQARGPMETYSLQKLCYYAQAQHLAWHNTRLFAEPIEAWRNGPVIPELWRRHVGRRRVEKLSEGDATAVEGRPAAADTIAYVLDRYGAMDGTQLSEMTHRELPWREARRGVPSKAAGRSVIPVERLRDFYREFETIDPVDEPPELEIKSMA